MCYLVLFWVSRSRKMATILTASLAAAEKYNNNNSIYLNTMKNSAKADVVVKMATILTASRKKFISVGPRF